jgi:hypothetical protein
MSRVLRRDGDTGEFGGAGFANITVTAGVGVTSDVADVLREDAAAHEIGQQGLQYYAEATDGSTAETMTVPSGKTWRLVGLLHQQTNSGDVATRTVTVTTRTTADATIEAFASATSVASAETEYDFLFGTDDYLVGSKGVAAQGTLTMDTKPTADDTVVINGTTLTWKAALTQGTENELVIGADVAASKATLEAALVDRDNGGVLHSVSDATYTALEMTAIAFAADDMVFTASVKGTAGNALATTETFTAGTNVFDAATLGTTTAGVDQAATVGTLDFPTAGPLLTAGEDVYVIVTNGQAADDFKGYLFYVEYDANPTTITL